MTMMMVTVWVGLAASGNTKAVTCQIVCCVLKEENYCALSSGNKAFMDEEREREGNDVSLSVI